MTDQTHRQALPKGFMLQEYQLDRVLGAGGFGLTYLGWDTALDKAVAVKEYLPNDLAVREANHSVAAKSGDDEDNFRWGLARFLFEARTLARFKHPNIVQVHRCFEAHGTAYIVMEFVEGETFDAYLKRTGAPKESFLLSVITALLDGLAEVHRAGFMHRDIKPGNIILNLEGAPVLVDFGSARQEIGGKSRSITSVVTPGYAPIEQYSTRGNQGPWTDIYALGAVAYRAITGKAPPDATERVRGDDMTPATETARDNYSAAFLRAIDWALAVDEDKRPQDVDAWRGALTGDARGEKPAAVELPAKPEIKPEVGRKVEGKKSPDWAWVAAVVGVLIVGGLVAESDSQRQEAEMYKFFDRLFGLDEATARLTPKCNEPTKKGDVPCWMKVANRSRCYLWEEYPRDNGRVIEWSGQCNNGVADGHGEMILCWGSFDSRKSRTGTGLFVNGKQYGHWVERFDTDSVAEGRYVDGKRQGHWSHRLANSDLWKILFKDGKPHGRWVKRNAAGTVVERRCYKNGDRVGC